jgi:hypothetical protein
MASISGAGFHAAMRIVMIPEAALDGGFAGQVLAANDVTIVNSTYLKIYIRRPVSTPAYIRNE